MKLLVQLLMSVVEHAVRLATFRARVTTLPNSTGFVAVSGAVSLLMVAAEQIARAVPAVDFGATVVLWLVAVVAVSMVGTGGKGFNKRVAGGMFLASIPIEAAMTLASWFPPAEWAVALWGGAALVWLLQKEAA